MVREIKLFLLKDIPREELSGAYFITGYQGFGMVGYLASRHVALELGLERIGFIRTKYFPEATFYKKGIGLVFPFELYYGKVGDKKLIILVNHSVPHVRERTNYAEFIAKFLKEINASFSILVGGLDPAIKEREDEKYRWIPINNPEIVLDAPILEDKHVIGPLALTMMFIEAYKIPGVAVFAYTELYRPDPRASAVAVNVIGEILGTSISTKKLLEEASVIEAVEEKKEEIMKAMEGEIRSEKKEHPMYM
ncbi:MAG: proteasome assembly chaperone family protein [Staphylothermus sp.]|nr:proteasome assembly chaperone family protein [Staphylothermus sp.]